MRAAALLGEVRRLLSRSSFYAEIEPLHPEANVVPGDLYIRLLKSRHFLALYTRDIELSPWCPRRSGVRLSLRRARQ